MPLQMASGKLFRSPPARINALRGVLYTNLELPEPIQTKAGKLTPANSPERYALVYEMQEHIEHHPESGALASRLIYPYLSDFAAVTAFGLNVVCTPDPDLKRRLIIGPPSSSTGAMPIQFVRTTFSERVYCQPHQAEWFAQFVGQLIDLGRKVFLDVLRAIRRFVAGMHRLGDDLSAAYTLLLSALEPLLPHLDVNPLTWADYPENRRQPIERALQNADEQTRQAVQEVLLKHEKYAIARRMRLFVDAHLDSSFFRGEAIEVDSPVGRSELQRCLGHAYVLRANYLHASKALPLGLTYLAQIDQAETLPVDRKTILTFEGLSRLVRHVILQFISRQESVASEPCDYSKEEPGIIKGELAPEHWLNTPGNFTAKDGQRRLFAFCGPLAVEMQTNEPPKIVDIRDLLIEAQHRFADMKPKDRRPFLFLFCLYNLKVVPDYRVYDHYGIVQFCEKELTLPTIEAMLFALLIQRAPQWPLDKHEKILRSYFNGKSRDEGIRINNLFEVGMILELGERYRVRGDTDKAKDLIRFAVENHPGNQSLMRFELGFDPSKRIKWREVMELQLQT